MDMTRRKDPTPKQIARACNKIQASWSEDEKERRNCFKQPEFMTVPTATSRCPYELHDD